MTEAVVATSSADGIAVGAEKAHPPLRVLVAASGTGGHLIPALHIIRALEKLSPGVVIECIGAGKPLEEKIFTQNGFKRHVISAAGVKRRGVVGYLESLIRLPRGCVQSVILFRRFRPDVVVGVGGYVTVLPVVIARLMGIPTWVHEAELHLGLANRVLARFADRISLSFEESRVKGRAKPVVTGHPVRAELGRIERDSKESAAPKRLLVLGGSQGARGIDTGVTQLGDLLCSRGIEVVHQCRPENMELVRNSYRAASVKASVVSFIDDMVGAYEWSDVVISRAGASSVAEIGCVNRPCILIPYPYQQGTHQSDNARALASAGKAIVVEETQGDFSKQLRDALERLLSPESFLEMKRAPFKPRGLEAANTIAAGILELARAS
jgi:UDP-N-acetylglucosamine--N-acetylmuramyl-(pentapeptide) pyrophosphoryl-undecaprenol N-acetylglucosamine transferase